MKYTLVRHSAWCAKRDPRFEHAVETASVDHQQVEAAVRRAGGVIYPNYKSADAAEYAANYPPGREGIIPRCTGQWARYKVGGRPVYIPAKEASGAKA